MMIRSSSFRLVGYVGAAALMGALFLAGAVQFVHAGCSIGWISTDDTCDVAHNGAGDFDFTLDTQWVSQNKGSWTLLQDLGMASPHFNVDTLVENVSSVGINDGGGITSGNIPTQCTGSLTNNSNIGSCALAAWDNTSLQCSGQWNVVIKPSGTCP